MSQNRDVSSPLSPTMRVIALDTELLSTYVDIDEIYHTPILYINMYVGHLHMYFSHLGCKIDTHFGIASKVNMLIFELRK